MWRRLVLVFLAGWLTAPLPGAARQRVLADGLVHLRAGADREWDVFPARAEGPRLVLRFPARPNASEQTLRLRQQDVRQAWTVRLNGRELGRLHQDENPIVAFWPVPPGALVDGQNTLTVEQEGTVADDVRVGDVVLDGRPLRAVLAEATVEVAVVDAGTGEPLPCRITVVDAAGALHTVGTVPDSAVAVRPGVLYTARGRAVFGLPEGTYTLYAGRGFEYGVDSARVTLAAGDHVRHRFVLQREVPTEGYVAADTHVHTFTHSGHGDATVAERMLTLAGEGVELPVATDHNVFVDYEAAARAAGVRAYFTPVIGNEVTTTVGHFNIFPASVDATPPDHRLTDWPPLFARLYDTPGVRAVVLNHPRDAHSGFRPFDPARHRAVAGENVEGRVLRAGAMEVINSGAQQTDGMRLIHDWFGLLNRGLSVTPVGGSDAHDVSRYIVGQARTYIRARDDDPGRIDVDAAVSSFVQGRVAVSLGLLAEITVDGRYGPGDLVPAADSVTVSVRVQGPGWTTADRVELYANGERIRSAEIEGGRRPGVKWAGTWRLARPSHDVFLVVVARGPGVTSLFWPIAKPYQHASGAWTPYVLGLTGAVWIDADADGRRTSANGYAQALLAAARGDVPALIRRLEAYDAAVAVQVAALLTAAGTPPSSPAVTAALQHAAPATRRGFSAYRAAAEQGAAQR